MSSCESKPNSTEIHAAHGDDVFIRLYNLMKNKEYTDFTIIVEGKRFDVHRNILAAKSPYFDAMFRIPMRESLEKETVEKNVDKKVFEILLEYMYTGQMPTLDENVDQLMLCADRYELYHLTEFCCESMKSSLTNDNAARYLASAHFVGNEELMKYILGSPQRYNLTESEDWDEFSKNFDLVTYVIQHVSSENAGEVIEDSNNERKITWNVLHSDEKCCSPEFEVKLNERRTAWKIQLHPKRNGSSRTVDITLRYTGEYTPPACICKLTFCTNLNQPRNFEIQLTRGVWEHDLQLGLNVIGFNDGHNRYSSSNKNEHFVTLEFTREEDKQCEHLCAKIFKSEKYFDAEIVVKGEIFHVHRNVLSEQSQVFASLFETELPEYELDDLSPDVFKEMLYLMYMTEGSQTEDSIQLEMLRCAINYKLDSSLIEKFESNFIDKLHTSHVVTVLILSHKMGLENVKSAAMEMTIRKISQITRTEQWKYLKPHHYLVAEILRAVTKLYT